MSENTWIMDGLEWDNPLRIRSWQELINYILQVEGLPRPAISTIRMNVDNFDEAYELLKSHGFTEAPGAEVTNTGSAKSILMMAPSRFLINVVQHIK